MTRPDVSVIIPVYNAAKYIEKCIDSILSQSVENIEVVAVNDCSADDSAAVLERMASADPRIKVINKERNEGSMMARHTGYNVADGRYFAFVDADDYLPDGALKKLLDKAVETKADIVAGDFDLIKPDGSAVRKTRHDHLTDNPDSYMRFILTGGGNALWGSLFSRRLFDEYEYPAIMHQGFADDRIVLTTMLVKARPSIAMLADAAYCYVVNYESMTRENFDFVKERKVLTALYFCYNLLNGLTDKFRAENDAFLSRYISLYIERGHPVREVPGYNDDIERLLSFASLKQTLGLRLAFHTRMCESLPLYGRMCASARVKIRRWLGK